MLKAFCEERMVPELEMTAISGEQRQQMIEQNRAYKEAMRAAAQAAAWSDGRPSAPAAATAPVGQDVGEVRRLLVPGQYIDIETLMMIRNTRTRQAIIDALYRGATIYYHR